MQPNKTTNDYFENKNKKLQKVCTIECKYADNRDSCYSNCVFLTDFKDCMRAWSGQKGIPTCQPAFFGPEASKYGELPK